MKKIKKQKNQKKQKIRVRTKWKLWMTIASVFLGVGVVAGATVFAVYLNKGFEEKVISPESIYFVEHSGDSYFEVDSDFELTLTTDTKDVTEDQVTLFFEKDGLPYYPDPVKEGNQWYISDGVIKVPETVTLGKPFPVRLEREQLYDDGQLILKDKVPVNWIKGGLSKLCTLSEASETNNTKINIAVDVPVYDTKLVLVNSLGEELIDAADKIVTNENFDVKVKFIPAKSEYFYSENLRENITQPRVKHTYFEPLSDKLMVVYKSRHQVSFLAGDEIAEGLKISAYTFKTAKEQIATELLYADSIDDAEFYEKMSSELYGEDEETRIHNIVEFSTGEASIGNFNVSNPEIKMTVKGIRLFMKQWNYQSASDYLGVSIFAAGEEKRSLDNLLSNIAIGFHIDGKDVAYGEGAIINVKDGNTTGRYLDFDGIRYYKPNISENGNPEYSYWDLTSTSTEEEIEVTLSVILLVKEDTEIFENAFGEPIISNQKLIVRKNNEKPLAWTDSSDLEVILDYDENGVVKRYPLNLEKLKNIPDDNEYQNAVFFVSFGSGELSEYEETAKKVFNEDAIDFERSGVYSTNSGNLALFAIEYDRDILYLRDTASFNLFYGTYEDGNGQPILDGKLYKMALMCSGYKRIICEKALNDKSLLSASVNTPNFPAVDGVVNINQGTELTFSVYYTIGKESVPVFRDEFKQGYMSPIIKDTASNDITSYFTIDDGIFSIDGATGEGKLEYNFKVKPAVTIEEYDGIIFGALALNYNNRDGKNITWETSLLEEETKVCIYKPLAKSISLAKGPIYDAFQNQIKVQQTLTKEGSFVTTILVNEGFENERSFSSIQEFLNAFIGEDGADVTILDQKDNAQTLSGQWKFVVKEGDANVISLTADSKSFTFKDTANQDANVKLFIQTVDERAVLQYEGGAEISDLVVDFVINSTGVTSIAYNTNVKTYQNTEEDKCAPTTEIASATVNKYGAKGSATDFIVLKDLISFYVADGNLYENVTYKLNPQHILEGTLSKEYLFDLFGLNGMITLYSDDTTQIVFDEYDTESTIRSTLLASEIYKIHIDKDFAIEQTLYFVASDAIGAVNTELNVHMLANIVVSSVNYPEEGNTFYAGEGGTTELINNVTNKNIGTTDGKIASLYDTDLYYIVFSTRERYELVKVVGTGMTQYGTFRQGYVTFDDFWDVETKSFRVFFQPEGDNVFAVNHVINFVVTRDLMVSKGDSSKYYLLNDSTKLVEEYVKITRITDTSLIPTVSVDYEFDNNYLTYSAGNITKDSATKYFFDYNVKSLKSKLYVKINGQSKENAIANFDIAIELYNGSGDIYKDLAELLTPTTNTSFKALVQSIGEGEDQVDYLMFDMSETYWKFLNDSKFGNDYVIKPSGRDANNLSLSSIYTVSGGTNEISFNTQKALLYGLNDQTKYITLKFAHKSDTSTDIAVMHLPIILSNIGNNIVVYEKDVVGRENIEEGRELEAALTNPEQLYLKGIYNEVEAGKLTRILSEIEYNDEITEGGLYTLSGAIQTLNIYQTLSVGRNEVINSHLITKDGSLKSVGYLTLNHLAVKENNADAFIAFEYIISKEGADQTFYYLLKVLPDTQVEEPIYEYDGEVEYITEEDQNPVDFEKLFDETTLHEGYQRFNISKKLNLKPISAEDVLSVIKVKVIENTTLRFVYNDKVQTIEFKTINNDADGYQTVDLNTYFSDLSKQHSLNILIVNGKAGVYYDDVKILANLAYVNEIVSVQVGENDAITVPEKWADIITITFSSDYRYMTYSYNTDINEKIIVTLKHTYSGSNESLAVIGAEQYYTFVFNATSENYTVRFTNPAGEVEESKQNDSTYNYEYEIKNSSVAETYEFKINLIKNVMAGGSLNQMTEFGKLDISIIDGRQYLHSYMLPTDTEDTRDEKTKAIDTNGFYYNKATGEFTLKTLDYIDSDKEVHFAIFIEQGRLALMTIKLEANVTVESTASELNGGTNENNFIDLFNVFMDGADQELETDFTIISVDITGDTGFVNWDSANTKIQVADLIQDKSATFKFTLDFGSGKTYIFSQTFVLKANIKTKTAVVGDDTIAGSDHEIDTTKLYEFIDSTQIELSNTSIILSATSSSSAFKSISGNIVSTNHVSEIVTVELTLNVGIVYTKYIDSTPMLSTQTYTMTYTFKVVPSAKLSYNYPVPNTEITDKDGNNGMDFEYLEDGATFTSLESFLNSKPIFGSGNRIVFKDSADQDITSLENDDLTIIVTEVSNATLTVDGVEAKTNQSLILGKQIVFKRGTGTGEAKIVLRVTYQEVSQTYTVKILKDSLAMLLNPVSNNLLSGEISGNKVSYEKIYVDKTSTSNLFAEDRMIKVQMNANMSSYAEEYYLIFTNEDETEYFSSYAIYLSANDQGKQLYFDLGVSMAGKKYLGAYRTSEIDALKLDIKIGEPIEDRAGNKISELSLPNYTSYLFVGDVKLANRVQMTYGQINGEDILVDYNKYQGVITSSFTFSQTLDTITSAGDIITTAFERNDGSIERISGSGDNVIVEYTPDKDFTLTYYYMPALDVAVKEEMTESLNHITVEVNQEYLSLVSLLGVIHPSTNRNISPADFMNAGDGLTFNILDEDDGLPDTINSNILSKYYEASFGINKFKAYAGTDSKNVYLYSMSEMKANGCISDYGVTPFGAKNSGDYVLGELKYTTGGGRFTKTFYIVIKIVPDYDVTFGGSTDNSSTEENGSIISNLDYTYKIANLDENDDTIYADFTLAGEGGYLSITHRNGGEDTELSLSNFTVTMEKSIVIDSQKYNDENNITSKLIKDQSINKESWTETAKIWKFDGSDSIAFTSVDKVLFGDQYYMLQGEDAYGYKYRLYFLLQATRQTPVATNTIDIVENGYFDIGIEYELLNIQSEIVNKETVYHINSTTVTPTQKDANVPLLTLEGIGAWLFDYDYQEGKTYLPGTEDDPDYLKIHANGDKYTDTTSAGVKIGEDYTKYLSKPDYLNVSITDIKFYDSNSKPVVIDLTRTDIDQANTFTNVTGNSAFATGEGYFLNAAGRHAYTQTKTNPDTGVLENTEGIWQIGKLQETDLFGSSNMASITMIITLNFGSEYCNLPVKVNILRQIAIEEKLETSVQRDGQAFDIVGQFTTTVSGETITPTYINDTLEVLVPINSSATFEISLKRGGNIVGQPKSVTVQNNESYAATRYVSLSRNLGFNVNEGDEVSITCANENVKFYYVTGDASDKGGDGTSKTFTISSITNDVIYVEDASLLSATGYYGVTKYYILKTNYGSGETYYHYRATRNYKVTGLLYNLNKSYPTTIGFVLPNKTEEWIEISDWKNAFVMYKAVSSATGTISATEYTGSYSDVDDCLSFSLKSDSVDESDLSMGSAEIESNGRIKLKSGFSTSNYIKVLIKMYVSGSDRDISTKESSITLATLNLSISQTANS